MAVAVRKVTPYLWYNDQAEEAANFYTSLIAGSKVTEVSRAGGQVLIVTFNLGGQDFIALNGGPDFKFNESFSMFVTVNTQQEVDELWNKLTASGGEESNCGWLKDKYGLSWQIIPQRMLDMFADKDAAKAKRAMDAMLQMHKIDLPTLEKAYAGS
jgi:predicted 3-demethylubiquinone-9 3-methyltransferase (glyoxalase superfamily)